MRQRKREDGTEGGGKKKKGRWEGTQEMKYLQEERLFRGWGEEKK